MNACQFDPVNGSHIPNRERLTVKELARAIGLGDVNKCVICGSRTEFSVSNRRFKAGCNRDHSNQIKNARLRSRWDNKDQATRAAIQRKLNGTIRARYGVNSVGQTSASKAARIAKFGSVSPFSSAAVRAKAQATIRSRFGTDNVMQVDSVKESCFAAAAANPLARQLVDAKPFTENEIKEALVMFDAGVTVAAIARDIDHNVMAVYLLLHRERPGAIIRGGHSSVEQAVATNIESAFPGIQIERNNRVAIAPSEIDLYLPDYRVGVEVNGAYWHSDVFRPALYHLRKFAQAREAGVRLFQIWDYELDSRHWMILRSLLANCQGLNVKLRARKMHAVEIPSVEARAFIECNHWAKFVPAAVNLGLVEADGRLVQVMTFAKARFRSHYEWELIRACSRLNTSVTGGSGKLLAAFIHSQHPKSLVSFSDNRLFDGSGMRSIGFTFDGLTDPNYTWIKNGHRITRYASMKHRLSSLLGSQFDPAMSEAENMHAAGFVKLHDAGQTRWTMDLS